MPGENRADDVAGVLRWWEIAQSRSCGHFRAATDDSLHVSSRAVQVPHSGKVLHLPSFSVSKGPLHGGRGILPLARITVPHYLVYLGGSRPPDPDESRGPNAHGRPHQADLPKRCSRGFHPRAHVDRAIPPTRGRTTRNDDAAIVDECLPYRLVLHAVVAAFSHEAICDRCALQCEHEGRVV